MKTVFDMLNLSPVISGYSSSLRVFDTSSFERFDLSANKLPEMTKSAKPSTKRDESQSRAVVEEVDSPIASRKSCMSRVVQTNQRIGNGVLFEQAATSRRCNGSDNGHIVFPLTIGISDNRTSGTGLLELCSPSSVCSDGVDSESVEGKMFGRSSVWDTSFDNLVGSWTNRHDDTQGERNGLKRMAGCCHVQNGISYDYLRKGMGAICGEPQLSVLSSLSPHPASAAEEDDDGSDLDVPFGTENGSVHRNAKRARNCNSANDTCDPCDEVSVLGILKCAVAL